VKEKSPSERQKQILNLIARGLTNKDIALQMGTAVGTVKAQIQLLMKKYDTSTRTELVFKHYLGDLPEFKQGD
jgi:DNA-binding NarL/FixJ family response regulator